MSLRQDLYNNNDDLIGNLVMLSCDVHYNVNINGYFAEHCRKSFRFVSNLVILADRGGQRFPDRRITENVLPIWFDHTATHNPAVWKNSTYNFRRGDLRDICAEWIA